MSFLDEPAPKAAPHGWQSEPPSEMGWYRVLLSDEPEEGPEDVIFWTNSECARLANEDIAWWDHRPIEFLPLPEDGSGASE